MVKSKMVGRLAHKRQVSSERKQSRDYDSIPDEANLMTCRNCPYPTCKTGTCDLIKTKKRKKKNETNT